MEDILLSVHQVAIILKVHPLTIRRYIKEGRLQAIRLGGNIRIPQKAIDSFSQDISSTKTRVKKETKSEKVQIFDKSDPIFRLKARGLSLKPLS